MYINILAMEVIIAQNYVRKSKVIFKDVISITILKMGKCLLFVDQNN